MAGRSDKLRRWLSQGGQRAIRSGAAAEVFSRQGTKLERESPGGEKTQVSNLLDPRLKLTELQRATGSYYGACAEKASTSGATEFFREFVDRSITGSGGATEGHLHMIRVADVARKAMGAHPAITYPCGKSRGDGQVGAHKAIPAQVVLDGVCLYGWKLETMGVEYGWTVQRMGGAQAGKVVVPDRQRKHLAESLRQVLDAVYDAWEARGISIPYHMTQLVVRE